MNKPRFWSDGQIEPKRSFRWYFSITGAENTLETYAIKTVKKPSFTVTEVPHPYVAHTFYYPGRVTWNTIDVTFVDPVAPDHSSILTNILYEGGYRIPKTEEIARQSFSKQNFVAAMGTPVIAQIDADANVIERWQLANAFITNVDFGQLDYSSEELVVVSLTLRYDYATLEATTPASALTP